MKKEKHYNAGDEKQTKEAEKKVKLEREQELSDLREILKTPHGLRFFRRFFEEGRVFCTTYTGNANTYYLEGHRALALKFFADITEAAPDKLAAVMIKDKEI